MRGTSNCTVIISDEQIGSPVVADPDVVIVFNRPSIEKFLPKVKKGGLCLFDPHEIKEYDGARDDVRTLPVPATATADKLGMAKVANVVMTGAYLSAAGAIRPESIMAAIKATLGKKHMDKVPVNEKALAEGMALGGK
jgi:2-oxoglutarate ferredoxin oxidoreductase subunit gamma